MANRHVQLVRSKVVVDSKPKLPQASALLEGELAVNYAKGYETISMKNVSGEVVTFTNDAYWEGVISGVNTTIESGMSVIEAAISGKADQSEVSSISATVDSISDDVDTLDTNVSTISGSVETLSTTVDELSQTVSGLTSPHVEGKTLVMS